MKMLDPAAVFVGRRHAGNLTRSGKGGQATHATQLPATCTRRVIGSAWTGLNGWRNEFCVILCHLDIEIGMFVYQLFEIAATERTESQSNFSRDVYFHVDINWPQLHFVTESQST